jgi:dipeptidyl aminopeptidase/acylaminoacyl peptidase
MDTMENFILSPEKMIFAPRLVEVGRSAHGPKETTKVPFTVREFNQETKQDTINIFLHDVESLSVKQLTRNSYGTKSLHPSLVAMHRAGVPELDHVLFMKQGKIHALPLDGGESYVVYEEEIPINSYIFFCDQNNNTFLLCEMDVYPTMTPAQTAQYDSDQTSGKVLKSSGVIYDHLMVRYWDNWGVFKKRNHLFTIPLEVDGNGRFSTNKEYLRDLMYGIHTDCPGKSPGNGPEDYAISPDGRFIAIACRKFKDNDQPHDIAWTTDTPVFLGELRPEYLLTKTDGLSPIPWHKVSDQNLHAGHAHPIFSPDSKHLAFLSMNRAGYESDRYRISVFNIENHSLHVLTENIDISFQSILWDVEDDGFVLYTTGQYHGTTRLFRMKVDSNCGNLNSIFVMKGDESRLDPSIASNYLYFQQSSLVFPNELKRMELKPHQINQIFLPFEANHADHSNESTEVLFLDRPDCISDVYCACPEYNNGDLVMPSLSNHYFKGSHGDNVQCWFASPVISKEDACSEGDNALDIQDLPDKSVPLLVIIHGGPQSAILNAWNYRWNLATFASQGYGVVAINFHGSTGFGESFTDSIRNDWGGKPYEDIMIGIDFILSQYKFLDPDRIAALGASYGGYMINWINGHSDRFKCLVNHDGIFSLFSQYYTTEELWFPGKYRPCLYLMPLV